MANVESWRAIGKCGTARETSAAVKVERLVPKTLSYRRPFREPAHQFVQECAEHAEAL